LSLSLIQILFIKYFKKSNYKKWVLTLVKIKTIKIALDFNNSKNLYALIRKFYSNNYRNLILDTSKLNENNENIKSNKNANEDKKNFDKEHLTIERIFRISLEESEKFLYLELFHAQLMSQDKEIAFRINQLDDIVIQIINHEERV